MRRVVYQQLEEVKMRSYRQGFLALALASAVLMSSAAFAGLRLDTDVVVDNVNGVAYGPLGWAHNSPDQAQYIGCVSYAHPWGQDAACYARNQSSAGLSRVCTTTDRNMIATIRSLRSSSRLIFTWDAAGHCTEVNVETNSWATPKT
jgi:hypothetical protein